MSNTVREDVMSLPEFPRILITRLSHIGDCVLTLPLLRALRRKFPTAYIAWAVEKPADQLLSGNLDLNQLIVVPRDWMRSLRSIIAQRRILREKKFDIVFDPQSLTKSAALGWLSGAPIRVGMSKPFGREAAPWLNNRLVTPSTTHLVDRTLDLLRAIDVRETHVEFRMPVDPVAQKYVLEAIPKIAHSGFIVINPGGTWRSKQWELDRFAAVADFARTQLGVSSVVAWAGVDERKMAEQIVRQSHDSAIAAPATNLRQLAALLAHAEMYVGGDTGPMHLAAAVGTPCVALFGPTRAIDSGPYGTGHVSLQAWYQSGTSRERRSAENLAMRDISVEQVCIAVSTVHQAQLRSKNVAA